jgi:hypothetical protein
MADDEGKRVGHVTTLRDADAALVGLATLMAMGKCTNCGATLDPSWKFCIACGTSVAAPNETMAEETRAEESTEEEETTTETDATPTPTPTPTREPIPSAIRPDEPDDEPTPRKRMDAAVIFGIAMAVGGGVLIILVAIALFSPRG